MRAKEFTSKVREDDDTPTFSVTAKDRIGNYADRPADLAEPKYPPGQKDYMGRVEPTFNPPAGEPSIATPTATKPGMPSAPAGDAAAQDLFKAQAKVFGLNPQAPGEPAPEVNVNPAERPAPPRSTSSTGKTRIEPTFGKGGGGGGFMPGDDDSLGMNKWKNMLR
jgi:hypothetical protein